MARSSRTGVRGLFRDADGTFHIDYRWRSATGERMRHREKFPPGTKKGAAAARAQEVHASAKAGTYVSREVSERRDREANASRFADVFDRYIAHLKVHVPRAAIDRASQRKRLVELLGERTKIGTLTRADVTRAIEKLRADGLSVATANRYLATVKHLARWAEETDRTLPAATANEIRRIPLTPEDNKRVREVHTDEERVFAEKLGGWLAPIVAMARVTGCRLGEITSMKWSQVDRAKRTIVLTKTKAKRTREVPITSHVAEVLETVPRGLPAAYVFPIPLPPIRTGAKRTDELLRRRDHASGAFHVWTREHGIVGLRAHDLRHDFASRLHRTGVRLEVVGKLLGHSQAQTTLRYAHITGTDLEREAAKLPAIAHPLPTGSRREKG